MSNSTIQLPDWKKSVDWMIPVTEGPLTECLLYLYYNIYRNDGPTFVDIITVDIFK